jgi:hypothetical protein
MDAVLQLRDTGTYDESTRSGLASFGFGGNGNRDFNVWHWPSVVSPHHKMGPP